MNAKRAKALRIDAIQRYEAGESATRICSSLGKSRQRLYKWLQRKEELSQVSSPKRAHNRTPIEIEEMVIEARRKLQNTKYAQIGVNAINRELYLQSLAPLPASTIKHIMSREGLQRKRLPYVPKGKAYPPQTTGHLRQQYPPGRYRGASVHQRRWPVLQPQRNGYRYPSDYD